MLTTSFLSPVTGYVVAAVVIAALWLLSQRARIARLKLGLPVPDTERHVIGLIVAAQILALVVIVANGYRGVPLALLLLAGVATLVHVITRHTTFGRCLYAIGGNEEAALLSGIAVNRVLTGAYLLMGVSVALTGFMTTAFSGASTTTVGDLMELDAIAACVIGGTALRGGRGTVAGVIFGALIMTVLLNGMTLLAVSPEIKFIARGVVLTLAVWFSLRENQG
jgi:D-xylose transport system permease protein